MGFSQTNFSKWHFHKCRSVTVSLHRLRISHNHLTSFNHCIDPESDPSCRHGCEALENENHCLLICPVFQVHRGEINSFFAKQNLPWNLETVLGLNTTIKPSVQFKIRNLLASFLRKSGLDKNI